MVDLLKPTLYFNSAEDIDTSILKKLNVKSVFFDIDCTLTHQDSKSPFEWVEKRLSEISQAGIKITLLSNNFKKRVETFAKQLSLPYISFAVKPLPFKLLLKNKKLFNAEIKKEDCIIIGDQIFTDVLCANLCGMKSILVNPCLGSKRKFSYIRDIAEKHLKKELILSDKSKIIK